MRSCVAVIGAGISGLAAAHRLTELDPSVDVMLLEAGPRLGGVLQTTRENGFLYEGAAQYCVGHRERIARIQRRIQRFPTPAFAGSSLNGVGIPACIQSGAAAAARIVDTLQAAARNGTPFAVTP